MNLLYRWLIGDMGVPGEYQYQAIHLYSTLAVVILVAVAALIAWRLKPSGRRMLLRGVCLFQLVFEVAWRLIYLFVKGDSIIWWWPAYPCNLAGLLIPGIALTGWQTGKKLFYLFGFVGGALTFALPEGIFGRNVLVFPILKSILQHTGLLLIPAMEYVCGTYRPRVRDFGWIVLGLVIHLINSEGLTRLLGLTGDYMFFRSGMPFVIPGVPQFFTLSVFALAVLLMLCALSEAFIRRSQRKAVTGTAAQYPYR